MRTFSRSARWGRRELVPCPEWIRGAADGLIQSVRARNFGAFLEMVLDARKKDWTLEAFYALCDGVGPDPWTGSPVVKKRGRSYTLQYLSSRGRSIVMVFIISDQNSQACRLVQLALLPTPIVGPENRT